MRIVCAASCEPFGIAGSIQGEPPPLAIDASTTEKRNPPTGETGRSPPQVPPNGGQAKRGK